VEYSNIKLEKENLIATISLNRPDALNALSPELLEELSSAVADVGRDEGIKALVIRGEGRAFCAGADLLFFDSAFDDLARLNPYLVLLNNCFFQLEDLPVPTIALVQGFALAGGLELALACDMVIAAEDARLGDQHANFGLMPGGGSTQRLPRRIGMQRAMELLTSGRWLLGQEAADWGLVLRAVPAEALDDELEKLLASLRSKSRTGLSWIKSITQRGKDLPLREGVALEASAFVQYFAKSSHPREGIQAFKEKRQPQF
jgi:enoyl-CoA hydratase